MKTFRHLLKGPIGRIVIAVVVLSTVHLAAEPRNYLTVLEQQRQKEEQIRAIAAKMNVDPEFLLNPQGRTRFDFRSLFRQIAERFGFESKSVVSNDQPADIRESVKRVKERYALVAADTVLARITQLVQLPPDSGRGKKKGQIKAELQSVLRLIDKDFLPPVKENASGTVKSRDAEMRRELKDLQKRVKSVLNAPHALDEANLESTLADLRSAVSGTITVRHGKPRWTRDPFPVKDTYRVANVKPAGPGYEGDATGASATTPAVVAQPVPSPSPARLRPASNAVAAEVTALANQLGTPAKIFAWVHDNIDWESYSGIAKGSLGTLQERRGNDWDQALLLRDLLAARGYNAQLEWGRATLPVAKAMNLVGTEDPLQAANLLATAGFDGLVLTAKGLPVAVQMTHVWVRAHIPYIPDRGATAGTPDTWVRMDPSFKRYEYQPGIAINGKVAWNEDEYLQTSAIRPPAEFYGDKIWNYIRTNDIDCVNLSQVTKAGRIKAANYPFVPATLTTKIDSIAGVSATPPAEQMQSVTMTVTDINGAILSSFTTSLADVWGKKLSITFPAATADDAATIASYGGLFNTPAYLIKLKPVFSIDDQPVADGAPVAAGAVLDLNTTFRQPNVADDFTHHELVAGETHAIVLDPGMFPDSLLQARINRLKTLTNEDAVLSEKLFLVGLRYMQHVDDGIAFAAGVRWQRPVKRVFEADVRRQIDITYNVAGAAIRLTPAENNIDVSRLLVGIVPINNDLSNRAQTLALAGLQSSYLEGSIWEEMESQQGISAAKALLLARMAGQQMHTVNASNVNTVLNAVNFSAEVENEIRGAVAQGRIAKIASADITLGRWTGTGYILQDPQTGAATYPISGGLAGGSTVDEAVADIHELYGSESWMEGQEFYEFIRQLTSFLGVDEKSQDAPSTTKSDPVNLSSGNMHRSATDFALPARGVAVYVTRTYNSRSSYNGPFGYGWTFNYGEMLVPNADGSVMYRESDGTEHVFTAAGGQYVSPAGKHLDLTGGAAGWTLTFQDGMQFGFDARGLLVSQTDLNGNRLTINRDANGLPVSVVDAVGRTVLTFTVTDGKITRVTDLGGRMTSYTYDGDDLVSVTDTAGKTWTMTYDLGHNMTSFADPVGNTQSYGYDADDRLFHHVDATGAEEYFQYDIAGRKSVLTDRRGGDTLVQYDDLGRATMEADPAGNVTRASFDADNNRTSIVDSRGGTTAMEYDDDGNIVRQVNPDGGVITTTYDEFSRPLTTVDMIGGTTTNVYDMNGNLTQTTVTVGGVVEVTTSTYDAHGQRISTTEPNGAITEMTWGSNGLPATRTDAADNTTTVGSDVMGRVTSVKDPAGNEMLVTYDSKDRVLTTKDAYGNTTTFEYDDAGRRVAVQGPRGTTRMTYDGEGRVLSVTDAAGNRTASTYGPAGDVLTQTDARGNVTRFEYDLAGRLTKLTDANGGVWRYGYCAALGCSSCGQGGGGGTFCEMTDPNGNTVKQDFDAMGRVIRVTDSLSNVSVVAYDLGGRKIAETDAKGNVTRYAYDEAGRLTSVTEATGAITSYTYDKAGNQLTQKDANGNVWSFKYDALNRLTEESDPLNRKTTYTYDALGNRKTKTDAKSQTTTYTYNVRRLTSIAYADGVVENTTYDALGRRSTISSPSASMAYTYDALNRVTSTKNLKYGNTTISYEYDALGNPAAMTTPKGRVTYAYDAKNRLTSIVDPVFGTFRFAYDGMDRRTELKYPNGVTTSYAYDDAYRLTALVSKNSAGAVVDAWTYQYDAVGNPISKTNMDGQAEVYRYDEAHRLTEASYANGGLERFTYDAVGNRLTRANESGTITTYSYDVANQLLRNGSETLSYDANGSLVSKVTPTSTTTFNYDAANRLTGITTPSATETNAYSPDGRRSQVASPATQGTIQPEYDQNGNPILDMDSNGTRVWIYRLYGPGMDEVLAEWHIQNSQITFNHRDAVGSVTLVTNTSGAVAYRQSYRAFGEMTRTGGSGYQLSRLGYTGRENSVGGLMQYRSRYYDTDAGRFLQQDDFRGFDNVPPSLHRYVYVINSPVKYNDPTGHLFVNQSVALIYYGLGIWMIAQIAMHIYNLVKAAQDDITNYPNYIIPPGSAWWVLFAWEEFAIFAAFAWIYFEMGNALWHKSDPIAHRFAPKGIWAKHAFKMFQTYQRDFMPLLLFGLCAGAIKTLFQPYQGISEEQHRKQMLFFGVGVGFCVWGAKTYLLR